MRSFLACPERVQEHEVSHIAGYDGAPLDAGEGQEFSIGGLIPVGAEVKYRDHVVAAFSEGLCHGGIEVRIKQ